MKNSLGESVAQIVIAYVRKDYPGHGLMALAMILVAGLAAIALAYAIGVPVVSLLRRLTGQG